MGRTFIFAIANADKKRGQIYNVGSDKLNFSKEEVCKLIESKVKCYVHYAEMGEDADKRNYAVSYNKLNSLGYDTMISVEQGIAELVKGIQVLSFKNPYCNV